MIAYLPGLYPDELFYSWLARYYCHTTPVYTNAIGDILEKRTVRPDMEFINHLNKNASEMLTRMIPMENIIIFHTMFPCARFVPHTRRSAALQSVVLQEGDARSLLPIPKSKEARYLKYCPVCVLEDRAKYGEAFWRRTAILRNVDVCAIHGCRLKNTNIEVAGKQTARPYVAEPEIKDMEPEFVKDGLELQFAQYMIDVFQRPIDMDNTVDIGQFLNSRLEGTEYLSARGKMRNITLLFQNFIEFYKELPNQGIAKLSQMQKIFTGYRWDFYEICQIAYFIGISADELVNPKLPKESQTELFDRRVEQLYAQGLGCHRIAKEMGCCPATVRKANQISPRAEHDYSVRKGIKRGDWEKMDSDMLQQVRDTCEQIYHNNSGRPGHVTVNAVCRALGFPDKRFDYLPKCREVIYGYEEKKEVYWAREVVWCYQDLLGSKGEEGIR
ncbi:MAG: TniQ family protein [Lachnospiraceae bacterium]